MPVQVSAVRLDAVGPGPVRPGEVRPVPGLFPQPLPPLFSGPGRQFLGLLQALPLRLFLFLGLQAQPLRPRLGALLLAFLLAGVAFAADRLQIRLEVVGAVIVIDLFARLDLLDGADHDLAFAGVDVGLGVRLAGVIDITRDVLAHRAVDGPASVEFEQVFVLDRVVLLLPAIQQRPKIADYFGALLDRFGGEEAKPGAGAADAIRLIRRNGRHDRSELTLMKATDREAAVLKRFRRNVRCFAHPPRSFPRLRRSNRFEGLLSRASPPQEQATTTALAAGRRSI